MFSYKNNCENHLIGTMKKILITTYSQNWSKIVNMFKHGCKNDHGQLRATISCTCSCKFIGYKRQDFLDRYVSTFARLLVSMHGGRN